MSKVKSTTYKAALKQEVAYQLENSLGKLKDLLGEKKFNARVKKAVKLITGGIKEEKKTTKNIKADKPAQKESIADKNNEAAPQKKNVVNTATAKKTPVKKAPLSGKETEKVVS